MHIENLGMGIYRDKVSSTVGTCMGVRGIQKELVDRDVHQLGILFHGSTETKIT